MSDMNALVIGCGRVGSNIALQLDREGWNVTAVDEKEEALGRLGDHWAGGFVLGHGMDIDVLRRAGIEDADAVVVSTDGDNTNIVIGKVAQQRFDKQCVGDGVHSWSERIRGRSVPVMVEVQPNQRIAFGYQRQLAQWAVDNGMSCVHTL